MTVSDIAPRELLQKLERAKAALEACDFARAEALSKDISDDTEDYQPPLVMDSDGADRPFTIIVVAHRHADEHAELAAFLQTLDPARFEIVIVENADRAIFDIAPEYAGRNFRIFRLGCNLGVGIARNVAIRAATGQGIILIDDDGLTDLQSLDALISLYDAAQAAAVRGAVRPRQASDEAPPHYAAGTHIVQRYCDIEGLSIWRRSEVMRVGMFDPILFGHEGIDLTIRLYPFNGPDAFLYQPDAVLWHDFYMDPQKVAEKLERYEKLRKYLIYKNPNHEDTLNVFRKAPRDLVACALLEHRLTYVAASDPAPGGDRVSIITTCYNGAAFIPEFVDGLTAQTDRNFELVFVDDGSDDGSADLLEDILPSGIPCTVIRGENKGRSAALNQALAAADCDICLIADVDDIPVRQRVAWTRHAFGLYPDADMLGFMIFDVRSHARASRPFPKQPVPLSVRGVFGMPAPFPGFAFRKSRIRAAFDESLPAGVDCDWMFRSLIEDGCDGYLIPLNVTFYRTHPGQITSSRRDLQRGTSLKYLARTHERLLGPDKIDKAALKLFAGWSPIPDSDVYWQVHDYGLKLLKALRHQTHLDGDRLAREINAHLDHLNQAAVRADCRALRARIEEQDHEIAYARASLDSIFASRSWRLTRPVRALTQRLKRG